MSATLRVSGPGIGWTVRDPRELALRIRLRAVRMVAPQGFGYLGQALSSAEQVAAVFACARPGLDRLVCSPGHYIIGPFAAAAELGLLAEDAVAGYGQNGSPVEAIGTERSPARWLPLGRRAGRACWSAARRPGTAWTACRRTRTATSSS